MARHLVVLRITIPAASVGTLAGREARLKSVMDAVDGFEGVSVWYLDRDPQQAIGVYEYRDHAAAEEGLRHYAETPLADEAVEWSLRPMDYQQIVVTLQDGVLPHEADETVCLSMSSRVAAPGMGKELEQDLRNVFDSLRVTPGYLGAIVGYPAALADERIGIALWTDPLAFRGSLPRAEPYAVELFRRARKGA